MLLSTREAISACNPGIPMARNVLLIVVDQWRGEIPADWRSEVHDEFDFREVVTEAPQMALGLHMDDCCLAVIRDESFKDVHFAALPPLFFDLRRDPDHLVNVAGDPAYRAEMLRYARKMLSWKLRYDDRRLTGMSASPDGLIGRR